MIEAINTEDYAYLYGFSMFETMLVSETSQIFLLDEHMNRLFNSMDYFKIKSPYSIIQTMNLIKQYVSANNVKNKILRITANVGNTTKSIAPTMSICVRENNYSQDKIKNGTTLGLSEIKKSETSLIISHKTSNYLENYLALQNAQKNNFEDCIFLNSTDFVTETTKANIFFVTDDVLYTPANHCGILPGIIRNWTIKTAEDLNIKVIEGNFVLNDFMNAREVFITNSIFGIMHVKTILKKNINNSKIGYVTRLLQSFIYECLCE